MVISLGYLLLGLWLVWAVWFTLFWHKMFYKSLGYLREPRVNYMKTCEAAARYDFINVVFWKSCLGAVILIPIRIVLAVPIFAGLYFFFFIIKTAYGVNFANNHLPRGKFYNVCLNLITHKIVMTSLAYALGTINLTDKTYSIYDFIPDYEPQQDISVPALAICNHACGYMDVFYLMCRGVSFVSKENVGKAFFLGMFAIARQSLFINRTSRKEKSDLMVKIKERIPKILNKEFPAILLFPEGTVSNGKVLMKFKKGAFSFLAPIKIYALKYKGSFITSFTNVHPVASIILSVGQLYSGLEFHEIKEPLCPLWVAKKHGIKTDDPELWKYVAKEAKDIMSFLTGLRQVETGFKEIDEFEQGEYHKLSKSKLQLCSRKCKVIVSGKKKTKFQIALEKKTL